MGEVGGAWLRWSSSDEVKRGGKSFALCCHIFFLFRCTYTSIYKYTNTSKYHLFSHRRALCHTHARSPLFDTCSVRAPAGMLSTPTGNALVMTTLVFPFRTGIVQLASWRSVPSVSHRATVKSTVEFYASRAEKHQVTPGPPLWPSLDCG